MKTQLVIIGGGAAGLMAAVRAGELGLRTVLIERKNRPGRKILLCGNNRCNLSSNMSADKMAAAYGKDVGGFLGSALSGFSPDQLKIWFKQNGLAVSVHKDGRIFPSSEKADDVLHVFTDLIRNNDIPVIYNSPVTGVTVCDKGLVVETAAVEIECENVLIATGGVSYPKTGSVGDGQKFARALGHKVTPYRPGLVGFVMVDDWLHRHGGLSFMGTVVRLMVGGKEVAETCGEVLCNKWGLSGPAMVNMSRVIARKDLRDYELVVDLKPELSMDELIKLLVQRADKRGGGCKLADVLGNAIVPNPMCTDFISKVLGMNPGAVVKSEGTSEFKKISEKIKSWKLVTKSTRPLKEAMVTVGGVALAEIDSNTMQSKKRDGLYFAGEVMDVDGPTGGFNLHAAFATARLAVESVFGGDAASVDAKRKKNTQHSRERYNPRYSKTGGGRRGRGKRGSQSSGRR